MVRDVRGPEWSFIQYQKLGLSGEIPIVVLDSPEIDCVTPHFPGVR